MVDKVESVRMVVKIEAIPMAYHTKGCFGSHINSLLSRDINEYTVEFNTNKFLISDLHVDFYVVLDKRVFED